VPVGQPNLWRKEKGPSRERNGPISVPLRLVGGSVVRPPGTLRRDGASGSPYRIRQQVWPPSSPLAGVEKPKRSPAAPTSVGQRDLVLLLRPLTHDAHLARRKLAGECHDLTGGASAYSLDYFRWDFPRPCEVT
jgi:hypothetical protein